LRGPGEADDQDGVGDSRGGFEREGEGEGLERAGDWEGRDDGRGDRAGPVPRGNF
jgi:hypothetical protein